MQSARLNAKLWSDRTAKRLLTWDVLVYRIGGWRLIVLGIWIKARAEERLLEVELDPQAYASYRLRVPMMLLFGQRQRLGSR
jgi:protein-S-isoprenylcysteine O-methyltransferase Ste14